MSKIRRLTIAISLSALVPLSGIAVELEQLHVPRTYLRYLPQLLDGARLMERSEQCHKFLSGKVQLDASEEEHPVFSYTCRDRDNLTYRWRVDGLTLEILDDTRPSGRISFAELQAEIDAERERLRQQEAERQQRVAEIQQERAEVARQREAERQRKAEEAARVKELERRALLWQRCLQALHEKSRNMDGVSIVTTDQPPAEVLEQQESSSRSVRVSSSIASSSSSAGSAESASSLSAAPEVAALRFTVDFDARDYYGNPLEYRAYCEFDEFEALVLSIHPRSLEKKGP